MPADKYKSFFEIVKMLCRMDLTKLRAIEKQLRVLSKVKGKIKRKTKRKKTRSAAQKKATAKLVALNKRRRR
jgi:hypothetical protein